MKTKQKGDLAVGQAIAHFLYFGYEVLLPIGDKRDYDLVVERNGLLERVQVKFAGLYNDGECKVGLRITGGNQSFNYSRKYKTDAFDLLFVFTQKKEKYLIPWGETGCRNEISIENRKYKKYRIA